MQKYSQEQFLEKYNSLPQELKTAISSVDSSDIIQAISKKFGLQIDQMGELASETGLVLVGLTKPEEYIRNLKDRLQIDPQKSKEIALEVNSQIFSKVKDSLKRLHGIEVKSTETQSKNIEAAPSNNQNNLKNTAVNIPNQNISASPLELIKKHESETFKKPENKEEIKNSEETSDSPALSSFINIMPNINDAPKQELENQISKYTKQTTEIKLPNEKEENKNIPFKNEHYPEGDPYKEPI